MGNLVFLSYSRKDAAHLKSLRNYARRLEESGLVELWHDEAILPGQAWADVARRQLDSSRLVLALITPHFLESEWCLAELARAFELRDRQLIDVVPIIVRQCGWRTTFLGTIQALPHGSAPIESYPDPEVGWSDVVRGIEQLLRGTRTQPALPTRASLVHRCTELLEANSRLMILAPWCEGLEELAQEVARRSHRDRTTLLKPPTLREMDAEAFYSELSRDATVTSASRFRSWLMRRCSESNLDAGGPNSTHLVVLPYFGGTTAHVRELGHVMRGVFEEMAGRFSMLAVGSVHCASLLGDVKELSLFSGIVAEHVPGLDIEETRTILKRFGADPAHADSVQKASGGHPDWTALVAVAVRQGHLRNLSTMLAENKIYGILFDRLMHKESGRSGVAHAAATLKSLLNGQRTVRLSSVRDDLAVAAVRLYFDGVVEEREGRTQFRCEAARIAAERAMQVWEAREARERCGEL